jgi:hypothetical protein
MFRPPSSSAIPEPCHHGQVEMTPELSMLLAQFGALTTLIQQLPQSVASESAAALRLHDHEQEVKLQKQQADKQNSVLLTQILQARSMRGLSSVPGWYWNATDTTMVCNDCKQ